MGVIITITLPASEFAIGRVIETVDGVYIELQTVVPLGGHVMPLLDVYDCDHDVFAERLQEHPAVESVVAVEQSGDEGVYAVEWTDDLGSFYQALSDQNGTILRAVKEGKDWEFDLLFLSHESLTAFREQINEAEISLDVRRISRSNNSVPDPRNGLSAAQREALDLGGLLLDSTRDDDQGPRRPARDLRSSGRRATSACDANARRGAYRSESGALTGVIGLSTPAESRF
jgi:hypothetical protein